MNFPKWALWLLAPAFGAVVVGYLSSQFLTGVWVFLLGNVDTRSLGNIPRFTVDEAEGLKDIKTALNYLYIPSPPPVTPAETVPENVPQETPERPPQYRVIFTYVGLIKSYAIIDGRLLKEGDKVSNVERIIKIKKDGVLLSGKWGKRWIKVME